MYKNIECVFYYVKGNIVQLETSASVEKGKKTYAEVDAKLETHKKDIIALLKPECKKNKPIVGKVYFCNWQGDFDEKESTLEKTEFLMNDMPQYNGYTMTQFNKSDKEIEKALIRKLKAEG